MGLWYLHQRNSRGLSSTESDADDALELGSHSGRTSSGSGGDDNNDNDDVSESHVYTKTPFAEEEIQRGSEQNVIEILPVTSSQSRVDRFFLDSVEMTGVDRLIEVCESLNAEICNCTQRMVDDLRERLPQDPNDRSRGELPIDVNGVIGRNMLESIGNAWTVEELEDAVEPALRAWAAHWAAMYIFDLLPTESTIDGESIVQFIVRNFAGIGPCSQVGSATFANSL